MSRRGLRRATAAALAAGSLATTLGSAAPPASAGGVEAARARADSLRAAVDDLDRRLAAATSSYEASRDRLGHATAAQIEAQRALRRAEASHAEDLEAFRRRVRGLYAGGSGAALVAGVFAGGNPADVLGRARLVQEVLAADRATVLASARAAAAAERERADLEAAARAQVRLSGAAGAEAEQVDVLLDEKRRLLEAADTEVRRLLEAEERERSRRRAEALAREAAAAAGVPGGTGGMPGSTYGGTSGDRRRAYSPPTVAGMACPVGPVHSFVDTWLAPRSGGRQHQGTDVFAPRGSTAYAVTDGVVDRVGSGGLGGITLWIRAANGDRFYYAHNTANLVAVGDPVRAGDPVALVGTTGNARGTPPHVHFEAHPRGGPAANPHPLLSALCS